jgi:hypothetical protein
VLDRAREERRTFRPPPHMGLGLMPSREPLQTRDEGGWQKDALLRSIEKRRLTALQPPLSARASVAELLVAPVAPQPPQSLTARRPEPQLPAANYSFPTPDPQLLRAAHEAAAASAAEQSSSIRTQDFHPSILLQCASPLVGMAPTEPKELVHASQPTLRDVQRPAKLAMLEHAHHSSGMAPAAYSLHSTMFKSPMASPQSVRSSEGKHAAEAKGSDSLQSVLPPLFPTRPQQKRKRGALKSAVRGPDGALRTDEVNVSHHRRRSSMQVALAPLKTAPSPPSAASGRDISRSSSPSNANNQTASFVRHSLVSPRATV